MSPSIWESKGIKRMNKIITNDIDVKYFFKPPTFGRLIRMVSNSKEFYEIFSLTNLLTTDPSRPSAFAMTAPIIFPI